MFLLALMAAVMRLSAQTVKFVEDGKTWEVVRYLFMSPSHTKDFYEYYTEGDTTVWDNVYTKMYYKQMGVEDSPKVVALVRQEGDRVYSLPAACPVRECLVYDFGAAAGDTILAYDIGMEGDSMPHKLVVDRVDSLMTGGGTLRKISFHYYLDNGLFEDVWIEGVGSMRDPTWNIDHGKYNSAVSYVSKCYVGDFLLYEYQDADGVGSVCAGEDENTVVMYDLGGRVIGKKPTYGVYIMGGKKYVGGR